MDPISPKRAELLRLTGPAQPKESKPKKADVPQELAPAQDQFLATPTGDKPKPAEVKKPAKKADTSKPKPAPAPVEAFQNTPQAIIQEDSMAVPETSGAKTLAEIAAEATKPKSKAKSNPTLPPKPPLSPGRKAGLLRRLGRGFLNFLTSDQLQPFKQDFQQIGELEAMAKKLKTPEQFQAKTAEFKQRLADGASLADIRNEAYAVARQAAVVQLGMRPYDCQVQGALAMDDGHIAEMRTGEGKTLTALLPLYLNALAGKGAHLVTVNDTLASRDAKEMTPAFNLLGMSVGTVLEDMKKDEKRAGYAADITYTTDRALGFDYLRDQTATIPAQRVQREPFFALVDEVDEVMIDEARSPLIISGQGKSNQEEYQEFNEIMTELKADSDYFFDKKKHSAWLSETGYVRLENKLQQRALHRELKETDDPKRIGEIQKELAQRDKLSDLVTEEQREFRELRDVKKSKPGWWSRMRGAEWDEETLENAEGEYSDATRAREELVAKLPSYNLFSDENYHRVRFKEAALKAHALFKVDEDYTIGAGKVEIVDQNKGRTSEGRRYNDGIHQALEAKHGVPIQEDSRTTATITYPNLFKRYPRLSGMSGTAKTSEYEFTELYDLDVVQIPTNKPVIRDDKPDMVFRTLDEKFEAIANDAYKDFMEGRPVLIGTLSVEHNEWVAKLLLEKGVPRESLQILNAETVRGDKDGENEMISQAGRSGVITVATNLAGRGANIKPDLINFKKLARDAVKALNEGQQVVVTVSKEEEAKWLQSWLQGIPSSVVPADAKGAGDQPVQIRFTKGVDNPTTSVAGDNIANLNGDDYPTNGLKVIGTERSFSRRIDDQLIGRSGRQGAPGESQFYLSLEDDMFRVFGSKHIEGLFSLFMEPGQGVQSDLIDTAIAKIQGSIESEHFSAREASNKQDEVLNIQRDTFFALREELVVGGQSLEERFELMVGDAMSDAIFRYLPEKGKKLTLGQFKEAKIAAEEQLGVDIDLPFLADDSKRLPTQKMSREDFLFELRDLVNRRIGRIMRALQKAPGEASDIIRPMILEKLDQTWTDHLQEMELLHAGVQWQSIAQKDPEVEFKLAAFDLFKESLGFASEEVTKGPYRQMLEAAEFFEKMTFQPLPSGPETNP